MNIFQTDIRKICLVGPSSGSRYLWVAHLTALYDKHAKAKHGAMRNASLRVLAEAAETRSVCAGKFTFHDPQLLSLAVRPEVGWWSSLFFHALPSGQEATAISGSIGNRQKLDAFSIVTAVPALAQNEGQWPDKTASEIQIKVPPLRLTAGTIPILVTQETDKKHKNKVGYWTLLQATNGNDGFLSLFGKSGKGTTGIFVPATPGAFKVLQDSLVIADDGADANSKESGDSTEKALGNGQPPRFAIDLVPEGIEFDAQVRFSRDTQVSVRLRLEARVTDAKTRFVLVLLEDQKSFFRNGLDQVAASLRRGGYPVALDLRPGTPRIVWALEANNDRLTLTDVRDFALEPESVRVSLLGDPPAGATGRTVARLSTPQARVYWGDKTPRKITISAGDETSNAAPVAILSVPMDAESGPRRFGFQLGNSVTAGQPTGDVAVIVDATPAGSPSSVFLALERGVARLPRPSENVSLPSAGETNAFEGLIHLKSASLEKGVSTISVDAAARAAVVIEYDAKVTKLETMLQGAVGGLDGYVWAATGLPSGEEIVPTLDNGPISLRSLPVLFGGRAPLKGYKASIASLSASPALTVTLETPDATLWTPHPRTMQKAGPQLPPVVSAVAMTRTLPNATEPSRTRDLVPVAYQPKSGGNAVRLKLSQQAQGPGLPLASVEGTVSRFGWPNADVPLAAVTLPGVEYAMTDTDKVTPTLRFDLPLLDDFHANATPSRKRKEEDKKTKPASAVTADTPMELDAFWEDQSRRRRLMRSADDIVWSAGSVAMPFAMSGSVTFDVENGTGLPLGAYRIEGTLQSGEEALAGLSANYLIDPAAGGTLEKDDNGPIRITGFATAPFAVTIGKKRPAGSTAGDAWQDTRGHAFARTSARTDAAILRRTHRQTAPDNVETRTLITSLQPTTVQVASGVTGFLAFRDLPTTLVENDNFKFQTGSELPADPYSRTDLPSSVYEWRHYAAAEQGKSVAHDIGFGPLRLKPLRLEIARFSSDGTCTHARVEYCIDLAESSVGSQPSSTTPPYGPDDIYRTGSVFSVNYEADGGSTALKARTLAQDGNADGARVEFRVLADWSAEPKVPRIAVDVTFGLKVSTDGIAVKDDGGELRLKLFGLQRTFKNARVGLDNGVLTIVAAPARETRGGLAIKGVKLTLGRGSTPKLDIEATLTAAPAGGQSALVVDIGRCVKLYATEIPAEGKFRINHQTGVVSVNLAGDASASIGCSQALARGLPPSTTARGSMVFVLHPAELGTPFDQAVATARADLHLRGDLQFEARFLLQVEDQKTTRRLTLSLGSPAFNSLISWPTAAIDGGDEAGEAVIAELMSATALAWKTPSAGSSMITVAVTPGKQPVIHKVQPTLEGFDIPEQALQHNGSGWIVSQPVRIKAVTQHSLTMGDDKSLSWSAIDDVTLIDVDRFVVLAKDEQTKELAFSPRFCKPNASKDDYDIADPHEVPVAGIVRTAPFGRAIGHYLQANTGPFKQGLALIGGAVHEAVLDKRQALTFGLPWIHFIEGVEAETQTPAPPTREWPLPSIPQMPSAGASKAFTVSLFDLASAVPHQKNGAAPLALSLRGRQIVDFMDELQRLKIDPALRVADLAFASNLPAYPAMDPQQQDPKVPDFEAPLFWRPLMALKRLFEVNDEKTLSFLTVFGDPRMERAARIDLVAGDLPCAVPQAVKARVFVFDQQRVEVSDLPATLSFDLVSASVDAQRRVLLDARTAIANPLAVKVARAVAGVQDNNKDKDKKIVDLANEHHEGGIAIDSIREQTLTLSHALRPSKDQTIHPEPSLSWPEFGQLGKAAESALNIGEESPIQDSGVAWAGRARRFAGTLVAGATEKAPASSTDPVKFHQAAFLAVGRRVIFARNAEADAPTVTAPPDRALTPIPPRARAPLPEKIAAAFTGDGEKHVGNFLPGHYELLSTGIRPGAMVFEHTGVLHTSNPLGFDVDHTRFGRPAERAPVVWTQGRAPRSTGLPKVNELDLRRRTFVGENIQNGEHLNELALLAGAAGVLRYLPSTIQEGGDSAFAKQTVAIFVRVKTPLTESHRTFASGKIELVFERPLSETVLSETDEQLKPMLLSEVLTRLGFLKKAEEDGIAPLYSLTIGDTVVHADTPGFRNDNQLSVIVPLVFGTGFGVIRQALVSATADTRAQLDIRAGVKRSSNDTATPALANKQQQPSLFAGPPRTLSIRLPVLPAFGPYLPIPTATLAFGDPAYDRELAGPAKTAIWRNPATTGSVLMLSLDRPAYDTGETIHFAAGELDPRFFAPASLADPTPLEPFKHTANEWTLRIKWLPKPTEGRSSVSYWLVIADPAINSQPDATTYQIDGFSAYGVAIPALRLTNGTKPAFMDGDRLNFTVTRKNTPPLTVTVTLVDDPVIAPSPAVYSLVTLDTVGGAQIATPVLYASAPLPTTLEFPDLLADLARGHVRRRALFVWRFVPRTAKPSAALVKIDRAGGGQIPTEETQFVTMQ